MQHFLKGFYKELLNITKRPKRIFAIFNRNRVRAILGNLGLRSKAGGSWIPDNSSPAFQRKVYRKYEDYIAHQSAKLQHVALSDYDIKYREILKERLKKLDLLRNGMTVLCLAARLGTEVKAFLDIGCFAIGIDLNPGKNNQYVLYGDFHYIQFPSHSVDVVFTNSLDHVLDIDKFLNEIKRILKAEGLLIVEASRGSSEGVTPRYYESFWWATIADLISLFEKAQLSLIKRTSIDYPWGGEQLCLKKLPL